MNRRQIEDMEEIARLDEERKRRVEELTKEKELIKEKELTKEKELDEWIEEQEEKARLGIGRFDVHGRLRLDPPQFPC